MLIKCEDDTKLGKQPILWKIEAGVKTINHWTQTNKMKFNRDKCKIMHADTKIRGMSADWGRRMTWQ